MTSEAIVKATVKKLMLASVQMANHCQTNLTFLESLSYSNHYEKCLSCRQQDIVVESY